MKKYNEALLFDVCGYILAYQKDTGFSPSLREIMKVFPEELSSSAKAKNYVDVLVRRGKIKKNANGSIAVDVRLQRTTVLAPLLGEIACGQPNIGEERVFFSFK